ncbi:MAG TPA: VCBS repeat-containing protein, partial [Gemmatimonadales bacterium]
LDLVVANPSSLSLMAGAGDGTFGAERRVHVAPGLSQLLLGDLQNTGRLDFVVTALNAVARVLSQTP